MDGDKEKDGADEYVGLMDGSDDGADVMDGDNETDGADECVGPADDGSLEGEDVGIG